AGRGDQDVVRCGSGLRVEHPVGGAQAEDLAAQPQFDAEVLEVDVEGGVLGLAEQHRLGQRRPVVRLVGFGADQGDRAGETLLPEGDRKSTRLNSSHVKISYAVFCLKKKKKI